jgi:polyhydroxyalkanoate synthesis regulator phasin
MAEPTDFIVPMLRELRGDMLAKFANLDTRMDVLDAKLNAKLDALSKQQKSFSQALSADTLLSRLLTGEFEERIEALERKVRELEPQK